jgi:hypothetical protein
MGAEKRKAEENNDKEIEDEELPQEDQEHGKRRTRPMLDPKLPSEAEVQQHRLTHMPYRNWCPHCVRGRGREMDHKKRQDNEEPTVPEYHMDYCFPGDEGGQKMMILVVVERHAKMKKAIAFCLFGCLPRARHFGRGITVGECEGAGQCFFSGSLSLGSLPHSPTASPMI